MRPSSHPQQSLNQNRSNAWMTTIALAHIATAVEAVTLDKAQSERESAMDTAIDPKPEGV